MIITLLTVCCTATDQRPTNLDLGSSSPLMGDQLGNPPLLGRRNSIVQRWQEKHPDSLSPTKTAATRSGSPYPSPGEAASCITTAPAAP